MYHRRFKLQFGSSASWTIEQVREISQINMDISIINVKKIKKSIDKAFFMQIHDKIVYSNNMYEIFNN